MEEWDTTEVYSTLEVKLDVKWVLRKQLNVWIYTKKRAQPGIQKTSMLTGLWIRANNTLMLTDQTIDANSGS
jgi:hypothetical protein